MYRNSWLPEVFNDFIEMNHAVKNNNATAPAINVLESTVDYQVELAAPGMRKEDFDVHINADGELSIKMENKRAENAAKGHYLRREFSYTKFEQTLLLPEDVDIDKIQAQVSDGVLTVTLPKIVKEEHKVERKITID